MRVMTSRLRSRTPRITRWLEDKDGDTVVSVSQDHIPDEKGVENSKKNWSAVLQGLKKTVEG